MSSQERWVAFCAAITIGIALFGFAQCAVEESKGETEVKKACIEKGLDPYCQPLKKQ